MSFKELYVNKLFIPNDTKIEIIIFYDDKMRKIFESCIHTIKNILIKTNITLSLIYVLSSYPSYSLKTEIEKNKEFRKEHEKLKNKFKTIENENNKLKQDVDTMKDENNQLKQDLKELKEKFDKLEKEKIENKNNDDIKIEKDNEKNDNK